MWALVSATWREKLSRPIVLVLCGIVCLGHVSFAVAGHELEDAALPLAMILGAGSIGRDVSSGVLALLFTRPLVRTRYVLARWLAVSAAAGLLAGATLLVEALVLARQGHGQPGADLAAALFESATTTCGLTSVLVLFSTLLPGLGDAALWTALLLVVAAARGHVPQRLVDEARALLQPSLAWGSSWFAIFSYLSTVALCLCLGALAANRKELSYATG